MVDTSFLSEWKKKLRQFYHSRAKKYFKDNKEIVEYIKDHAVFVLIYGFIVNYALFVAIGVSFHPITIPGWGFAFYLFKEEIPEFIHSCRYGNRE